jgi:large subunit ribosomal protein L25
MAKKHELSAEPREERGKNAMRRIRKAGMIPGIIFGRSGETTPITFSPRDLEHIIHSESGFNTLFTVKIKGEKASPMVIIKDYQVEPVSHDFLHVSFYRIHMDRLVEVDIPIYTRGLAYGVKNEGGILDQTLRELHVECFPGDIPESFTIDVSPLHLHDGVHVNDLDIPEGVKVLDEMESVILQVTPPKRVVVEEVEEELEEVEAAEEGEEEAEAEEQEETE